MYGVVNEVWCRPCPTNLQSPTHCVLLWLFCGWGAAEVSRGRSAAFPRLTTSRSGAPGRTVGEVEDSRKDALVCTACGVTRASLVRARAARAFSEAAESRRAVAHVPGVRVYCTGCGAVRGASVSSHLHDTSTLLLLCPMQPRYIGHTAPHTAFGCGEQVPDVAIPHYKDARMQHSPMQCPSYTAPRVGNLCGLSRSRSA